MKGRYIVRSQDDGSFTFARLYASDRTAIKFAHHWLETEEPGQYILTAEETDGTERWVANLYRTVDQ